jgi:chromosomal replication initiation ATPase DnaA
MSQEFFDFGFKAKMRDDNFIVSESNNRALGMIEEWPHWKNNALFLYGPKESGKTMLANIWKKASGAVVLNPQDVYTMVSGKSRSREECYIVENIENIHDESTFLHFFNSIREDGGYLLITAYNHPSNLKIRLADLRSRINALVCCSVSNPDNELLRTLFFKYFVERQLRVEMSVVDYLVARTERSFFAVQKIVDELDKTALKEKKNITIPFVKHTLITLGYINDKIPETASIE